MCRGLGVVTPEDPYPVWTGRAARSRSRRCSCCTTTRSGRRASTTKEEALARAYEAGVVCTDEFLLHPDPYPSREAWCRARVARDRAAAGRPRPGAADGAGQPLSAGPRARPRCCATRSSRSGAAPSGPPTGTVRFRAAAVVYGHLHIPRTTWHDGVRFEEVSVGYPREWRAARAAAGRLRGRSCPCRGAPMIEEMLPPEVVAVGGVDDAAAAAAVPRGGARRSRARWTSAGGSSPPRGAAPGRRSAELGLPPGADPARRRAARRSGRPGWSAA